MVIRPFKISQLVDWREGIIAIWLLALAIPPALAPETLSYLQAAILLLLFIPSFLSLRLHFLYGPVYRHRPSIFIAMLGLVGVLMVSAILSEAPIVSIGYVIMIAVVLISSSGIWEISYGRMLRCLRIYAIAGSLVIAYFCLYREQYSSWFHGRLSFASTSHPNYVGLISFGFLAAALALENRYLRVCLLSVNLAAMIYSQSRSALLAAIVTVSSYCVIALWRDVKGRSWQVLGIAGSIILIVSSLPWSLTSMTNLANGVFLLDDRYRGLGTGFTGRIEAWEEAFGLFQQNPVFGVGFRMHERYMVTLSSAHNGYLSMLADTGLTGVTLTAVLVALLVSRSLRLALRGDRLARLGLSFWAGYCVIAMFERFFLNAGNPTSLLMWILLFVPGRATVRTAAWR